MGIPMNDMHAPPVAAGPTSTTPAQSDFDVSKLSLDELFDAKDHLEAELDALASVLESVSFTFTFTVATSLR